MMWHGLACLIVAAVRVNFFPRGLAAAITANHPPDADFVPLEAEDCVRVISRLSRQLRPEPSCLIKALALKNLMRRYGQESEIRLMVRKKERGGLEFHSVVCTEGRVIFGTEGGWTSAGTLRPLERNL